MPGTVLLLLAPQAAHARRAGRALRQADAGAAAVTGGAAAVAGGAAVADGGTPATSYDSITSLGGGGIIPDDDQASGEAARAPAPKLLPGLPVREVCENTCNKVSDTAQETQILRMGHGQLHGSAQVDWQAGSVRSS
jgi:hypothetical protein